MRPSEPRYLSRFFFIYKFSILIRTHYLLELCEIVLDSECDMWNRSKSSTSRRFDFGFHLETCIKTTISNIGSSRTILRIEYMPLNTFLRLRYWFTLRHYEPNNNTYFEAATELEPISRFVKANTVSRSLIIYHDRHIQCYMRWRVSFSLHYGNIMTFVHATIYKCAI